MSHYGQTLSFLFVFRTFISFRQIIDMKGNSEKSIV